MKGLIGLCLAALLLAGAQSQEEEEAYVPFTTRMVEMFTLAYKVEGEKITVRVACPTSGWVAIGFNPVSKMKGANYIIGYATKESSVVVDEYGTGTYSHAPDTAVGGTADLENASCLEIEGVTTISFTMPLASGDKKDGKIVLGEETKVILAAGKADNLTTKHFTRASTKIRF